MKILRNKLAILWPEMAGLLDRYRIKCTQEASSTEEDMMQDILSIEILGQTVAGTPTQTETDYGKLRTVQLRGKHVLIA